MRRVILMLGLAFAALSISAQSVSGEKLVLSLEQALEIALSENLTIKVADPEIEIKRYAKQGTYAGLYPQIDATAQYQRIIEKQTMSMNGMAFKVGTPNTFSGGVTAAMPIVSAQLWTNLKISALDVELAVEKARSSRIDMVEQVTSAYYLALLAKESHALYKRVYDNAVENNKIVKDKYDVGSVSEFDLIRSNVTVQNAIPNVVSAENSVTLALWQLKALLGINLEKDIDVVGSLLDYESVLKNGYELSQLSLDRNSSLVQLGIQEDMLEKAVKLTKMANVPTLSANIAYLYTAMGTGDTFFTKAAWNPYSYAGLQLNIPIFAGNKRRAATREARLNLANLKLQRENTERQLRVAIVQHLNNMQTSVKTYHSSSATVGQAQRGYDISVKRYEVGSGTLVDIDNSQLALTQAELSRNQSIYNFLTAKVSLDKVLGAYESDK